MVAFSSIEASVFAMKVFIHGILTRCTGRKIILLKECDLCGGNVARFFSLCARGDVMDNEVIAKARIAYECSFYKTILKTEKHMALHSTSAD
ncbi:hypothetical protein B2M27_02250 [Kluyvera intermedia]|jgi:hypothetical protein|uniref:Uncharacterized protein n=2 Tax=Enterobacteriaceae TaxID=543 RepID=A0AAC8QRW9_9ENTR|nr:hypothetical protein AB182_22255 [Phytobacter ursingii]ORJ52036.1 hypothetical protein B2M27_02250 [Kluyvera intermedia]